MGKCITFGIVALGALLPVGWLQADPINLTQYSAVQAKGTYTYYARGDASYGAITPFKTMFYPGAPNHRPGTWDTASRDGLLDDSKVNAQPVSIRTGELTDNNVSTGVWGWIGVVGPVSGWSGSTNPHYGTFDILIDLGAVYDISDVKIAYTDSSGLRWATTTGSLQQVFTAVSLTPNETTGSAAADSDFTLFNSATFNQNATPANNGTADFLAPSDTLARYILFRGQVSVSPDLTGTSAGGTLDEITVHGNVVPEASSLGVLGFAGITFLLRGPRKNR